MLLFLGHSDDPEIRWRVRAAAATHLWGCLAAAWDQRGWPWVDAIDGSPWQGLDLPREASDQGDGDWPEYKRATRIWLRWQLDVGRSPADLHAALLEAEHRCIYWRQHRRYPP